MVRIRLKVDPDFEAIILLFIAYRILYKKL